jgi:arsenate reductase
MTQKIYNVLFICTANSARSIIAQALLNQIGKGKFQAFSAGSQPSGQVNPFAIELLQSLHCDTSTLQSKSWDTFALPDAPSLDFVFAVCDKTAGERCPVWSGHPISADWGVADPTKCTGTDEEKRKAFYNTYLLLNRRISLFCSLPIDKLDAIVIKQEVNYIGLLT